MRARWEAPSARARGLGTHLLSPETMAAVAAAPDLTTMVTVLEAAGVAIPDEGGRTSQAVELGIRRAAAGELRRLARWFGDPRAAPSVLFDEEDRRSLRAMIRGAVAGAPTEARLAGLIPTPGLPERALAELASQPRVSDVAALLVAWNHPLGSVLLPVAGGTAPDLLRLELEVDRWFARRAHAAASHGGRAFRHYVEQTIDLDNARAALLLAASGTELPAGDFFLPGGRHVSRAVFLDAAAAGSLATAARQLAVPLAAQGVGELMIRHAGDVARLDWALLRARVRALRLEARRDPLGAAPVLAYVLRLRAQVVALRRCLWGMELGLPPAGRAAALEDVA